MRRAALAVLAALPVLPAMPGKTLWTIGTPDHSSREFGTGRGPVAYEVGRSTPAKDWRRTQPAAEPFIIRFSLAEPPAGSYQLNVSLLFRDPAVPRYQVTVNGKSGSFGLRPEFRESTSDADLNVLPSAASQRLSIDLPARLLRRGDNEIQLRAEGGSVDYDAVSLDGNPARESSQPKVRLEPAVLWRRTAEGLCEDVNVIVDPGPLGPGGKAAVRIGAQTFERDLPADWEFGETTFPLPVRDTGAGITPASIRLNTPRGQRTFQLEFKPQRKWKLYVASSTHLDIGYTAVQPKAVEVHLRNLEEAAALAEQHPSFRWNVEGSWAVQQFLDRGGARAVKALELLAGGSKLGVNAFEFNLQTFLCSLEELNVATDRAYLLHELGKTPFQVATVTDVPSLTWSLPSILHRSGIRYLASGANQVRGPLLTYSGLDRSSPFFWEGPDGGRVLVWYTKSYAQVRRLFGIPGSTERGRRTLQTFLTAFPEKYPYDAALVYGFDGDNAPIGNGNAGFFEQWNEQYAYPRIIPARYEDFFSYIEQQGTAALPVFRGDGGAYWEDGAGECPIATALNRANQAAAVDFEKLTTLATLSDSRIGTALDQIQAIWSKILLFDEHTFGARAAPLRPGADDSRLQWQLKSRFATEAAAELRWKRIEWLDRLNRNIPHPRDAIVVWNLDNWRRSGPVEIELPSHRVVYDAETRQPQPCEIVSRADNADVVRFLARDVPPLSYKIFVTEPGDIPDPGTANDTTLLENEFYKVTLDPRRTGITSIWDKQLARELVSKSSGYALGEYFKVRETSSVRRLAAGAGNNWGSGVRTQIDMNDPELPAPALSVDRAGGRVTRVRKSGLGQEAVVAGAFASGQKVELTVRLNSAMRRVDLEVRTAVDFARDGSAQAGYVAFPFSPANPEFAYNLPIGWVNPAKDMLPGGATEWFAVDSAASVTGQGATITLATPDAPLITFGDINRGRWPKSFVAPKEGTVFSYLLNNYWLTNFPAGQETGEAVFRYSITSAGTNERAAQRRFGEEQRHPLLPDFRQSEVRGAARRSLVDIESAAVNLVTMKPARSGRGYVLRLAECGGKQSAARIQWNGPGSGLKAFLCSMKERKSKELAISGGRIDVTLSPHAVETILLEPPPE